MPLMSSNVISAKQFLECYVTLLMLSNVINAMYSHVLILVLCDACTVIKTL